MNLGEILMKIAADAAKATAQHAASSQPRRGSKGASSCSPCAAHAYVEKIKQQAGLNKKR